MWVKEWWPKSTIWWPKFWDKLPLGTSCPGSSEKNNLADRYKCWIKLNYLNHLSRNLNLWHCLDKICLYYSCITSNCGSLPLHCRPCDYTVQEHGVKKGSFGFLSYLWLRLEVFHLGLVSPLLVHRCVLEDKIKFFI